MTQVLPQFLIRNGMIYTFHYEDSPTQRVNYQVVNKLNKVEHNHLMLSLDKTKDIKAIESFVKGHNWIAMAKMDGLTCSLRYLDGELVSAETRGNGFIGEDVTHNAKVIPSIPKKIDYKGELIIDGEIICTYKDFEPFKDTYKNPRNFASGSIRLLDSKECSRRHLTFIAWDVIKGGKYEYLSNNLSALRTYGFEIVPMLINDEKVNLLEDCIDSIKETSQMFSYPIDGVVFKYDVMEDYIAAGRTDHHFKGGLAYKFYDETYPTRLKYINWTMGRTGILTPVAVFDPIDIDGSTVERASLHNVSVMREILGNCAYVGEPLQIYKANQIIPQIAEAGPKYDYGYVISHGGVSANDVIEKCPICGHDVAYIESNDGIINAYCDNPQCEGKLINKLDHFCSKKGLDIKGISKATLEKLIDWGWISCFKDIFRLHEHKKEWITKEGFGEKSVQNILDSIEKSRTNDLWRVIAAAGIPNIGVTAAKQLADYFKTYAKFRSAIEDDFDFTELPDFGEVTSEVLLNFNYEEIDDVVFYAIICNPVEEKQNKLDNITFCVTGKLHNFKNRTELKNLIESLGGKVTDSVSSKTNYLINNDINSASSKNRTAKSLNIPILTEEEFASRFVIS